MNHKAARVGVSSLLISLLLLLLGCASKTPEQLAMDGMFQDFESQQRQMKLAGLERINAQIAELEQAIAALERQKEAVEEEL